MFIQGNSYQCSVIILFILTPLSKVFLKLIFIQYLIFMVPIPPIHSANSLAKRMEVVWLYYELSRFVFVTSREKSIVLPKSLQPEPRFIFIEQNLCFLNHIFNVFWSRHSMFPNIKCKETSCSRVMLTDGHQKSRRVICRFENLTNTSHPEMGPVNQGCPYQPQRCKKKCEGQWFVFGFFSFMIFEAPFPKNSNTFIYVLCELSNTLEL